MSLRRIAVLAMALGGTLAAGQRPSETAPTDPGAAVHDEAATSPRADAPPAGLSREEWSHIRSALEASSYHAVPLARPGEGPALVARNRQQRYRIEFRREGIEIVADPAQGNEWRLGLSATGFGYEDDVQPLRAVEPQADQDRVEYRRGSVTEWYVNRPEGLEQGFTIAEPVVRRDQPLVIELAVEDLVAPLIDEAGVAFRDRSGVRVVRYRGLKAWDRDGRVLPARLVVEDPRLLLVVDTAGARFPVTVDPTFVNEAKLVGHSDPGGQANAHFGVSVSISGDTLVVGADMDDTAAGLNAGSVDVFVRSGTSWTQQAKLLASDGAAQDNFGQSVSISGDTVVVGAPWDDTAAGTGVGSAYVFVRSGTSWTQQAKLLASDGFANDSFGRSVSISGDTVVAGVPLDDTAGPDAGSAYAFVRSGTAWTQQAKLVASDRLSDDYFGLSVSIWGETVVVGAWGDDTPAGANAGSAYVFVRSGTSWTEQAKLLASDGAANDTFGLPVSISEDTIAVGASHDTAAGPYAGSAYVFERSGTSWTEQARLVASDGAAYDYFGRSVSVSGDTVVVGAWGDDMAAGANAGSAYVFERSGTSWTHQAKLQASDWASNDYFGLSALISGDTVVFGAEGDDTAAGVDAGSAYVFERSGTSWTEQAKLLASDGAANDTFGQSVSISGDTVVVGAYWDDTAAGHEAGSAYVFVRSGATWMQQAKLRAPDAATSDQFGSSVSISGDTIVVGAWVDDTTAGPDTGSAYVFVRSGTTWTQQAKLVASDAAIGDYAGMSVSISGDTIVVGAFGDDTASGSYAGSAYVFVRSGTTWTQQAKLLASDGAANDRFGLSVSISGDTLAVGAMMDDTAAGADAGSAYVFVRTGTTWTQQAKLLATDGAVDDEFGASVSISGDTLVVGAWADDTAPGADSGSAHVFVRSGTSWTPQAKLLAADGSANDGFGISVTIAGDTIVAGASLDDTIAGVNAGSVYVFVRAGTSWTEQSKLLAPDGAIGDDFGWAVSMSGDTIVVGADWDDTAGGVDAGSAYVFRLAPADLAVTLVDSPDPVTVPGTVTHTIAVSNAGPSEATNVRVVLSITSAPATGVSFLGASGSGWSCSTGGATVTCMRPGLASGASAPSLGVQWGLGPAGGTLVAQAAVSATEPDPQSGNNTAIEPTTVNGVPYTDLGISIVDSPDPLPPEGALTYTLQVSNLGPEASTGMTTTDSLPGGVTFVSSTPGSPTCTHAGGTVTCDLPGLAPSASHTITIEGAVNPGTLGTILNTATVVGQELDPVAGNDSDIEPTVVGVFESELGHGSALWADLESVGGVADEDLYRIGQTPYSSYEVVVDGTSGDIGAGGGPLLERLSWAVTTVVQSAVPVGAGPSRSLRWENARGSVVNDDYVRVRSAGCTTDCGPEDVYRIRSWDTTLVCPRFNNSATQVTVLLLQNTTPAQLSGHAYFWSGTGALLGTQPFSLGPKAAFVLNTSTVAGVSGSGSITLSHDGSHGTLVGKAVALEPATGFAFDTPLLPRAR